MDTEWRFGLLGPLDVTRNGIPVPVRAAKQRALLASLLVDANRVVSIDELVARLWEGDPPTGASTTLRSYAMRLRQALGPDAPILTRPEGYLVQVDDEALDVTRFEETVRRAEAESDPAQTAELFRTALGLWRGTALSDVPSELLRQKIVPAWAERRLLAVESRIDADLALARHRDLIPELAELTAEHPFREKFWQQRMLALYRSGRQADALDCYRAATEVLAEELGVDPGLELRELHQAVLTNSVASPTESVAKPVERPRRNDLPADVVDFSGRAEEMESLLTTLDTVSEQGGAVVISAIDGMAGVGKTALAVHAAHRLTDRYPDGQLFIDLRAHTADAQPVEPAAALDTFLRALGVAGDQIPAELDDRAALWRSELADRRALVVLDNAASAAQVRPLLPGASGCLVLVTSRRRLVDLDTARTLSLDVLPASDARDLFVRIVGADRIRTDQDRAGVDAIVQLCGCLPLAIRIAAARLRARPSWSPAHLSQRLADDHRRLAELEAGDRSVAAAFTLSYRDLDEGEQRIFRLLGLLPGADFDAYVSAAVANVDLVEAEDSLERLVDMHLLQQVGPGRYRFHDLLREHARHTAMQIESSAEADSAVDRSFSYYLYVAGVAGRRLHSSRLIFSPDEGRKPEHVPLVNDLERAHVWFGVERENLIRCIVYSRGTRLSSYIWQLAYAVWPYLRLAGYLDEWIKVVGLGLGVARELGEPRGCAELCRILGNAYFYAGQYDESISCENEAIELSRSLGDTLGEGAATCNLASTYMQLGRYDEARKSYADAIELATLSNDLLGQAIASGNFGVLANRRSEFEEAATSHARALDIYRELGDRRGEAMALSNLGDAHVKMENYSYAIDCLEKARAIQCDLGASFNIANTLSALAVAYSQSGQYQRAVECCGDVVRAILEGGNISAVAEARNDIAFAYRLSGEFDAAREQHQIALELAHDFGESLAEARAHDGLGHVLRSVDPAQARRHWESALRLYTELSLPEADEVRRLLEGTSSEPSVESA